MIDDPNRSADPAAARFMIIQIPRLGGVAMAMLGLLAINGKIALPVEAGYVLTLAGVLDALFAPILLARAWKTPLE